MTEKGLNLFDECSAECVPYICVLSAPSLPEGTVKCTHMAP